MSSLFILSKKKKIKTIKKNLKHYVFENNNYLYNYHFFVMMDWINQEGKILLINYQIYLTFF